MPMSQSSPASNVLVQSSSDGLVGFVGLVFLTFALLMNGPHPLTLGVLSPQRYCCKAYLILRKSSGLFVSMFDLVKDLNISHRPGTSNGSWIEERFR